jgi:hypothetical protein
MSAFQDTAHAAEILGGFFRQEAATSDDKGFAGSGVVIGYMLTDIDLHIVLDARKPGAPGHAYEVFINDPNAPKPTADIAMDSETFDKLYKGEVQPMALMMDGNVKARGDMSAAMRLLPSMARAIPRYRAYRASH